MTAEIAILNVEAVALAADSAVTVRTRSGAVKIFNSANKLLALSSHHPVGVMVYGNASLVGLPWETVVKRFRDDLGGREYDRLSEYAAALFAYLNDMTPVWFSHEIQDDYIRSVIRSAFEEVRTQILDAVEERLERSPDLTESQVSRIGGRVVGQCLNTWHRQPYLDGYSAQSSREIAPAVEGMIQQLREEVLEDFPFSQTARRKLDRIGIYAVVKFRPREGENTGVVIAGFGGEQLMPCLESYHVAGVGLGQMRFLHDKDTSRCVNQESTAAIVPFAQSQVIAAFMDGIDPELLGALSTFRTRLFDDLPLAMVDSLSTGNTRIKTRLKTELAQALEAAGDHLDKFLDHMKFQHFALPVVATIAHMPRDELARVAETLVNLASFRQRVTMSDETVGGPIDVAVISRGDGFIWIKRKHYFDVALNPRFVARLYERGESEIGS